MSRDKAKSDPLRSEVGSQRQVFDSMICPECGEEMYQKDAADLKISQISARKIFESLIKVRKIKDVDKCVAKAEEWLKKYGK